jgi:alkylated DNA repair dioxygenase AlkB
MQADLFDSPRLPPDLVYRTDFITREEERALLDRVGTMEFSRVEMRGVVARRRTAHFGWTYGYYARRTKPGVPLPDFLQPLQHRVAEWAGLAPSDFEEALVTEYPEGAPIGWHRDAPMFGDIVGISLGAMCRMKFRPYESPKDLGAPGRAARRTTHELELAPRSAYLMRGVVRQDYEHSIPPVDALRYSITLRTLRETI